MRGTGCGENGLALMGRVMLSKLLIQFADVGAWAPSLLVVWLEATHSWKGKPVLESTGSMAELKRTLALQHKPPRSAAAAGAPVHTADHC